MNVSELIGTLLKFVSSTNIFLSYAFYKLKYGNSYFHGSCIENPFNDFRRPLMYTLEAFFKVKYKTEIKMNLFKIILNYFISSEADKYKLNRIPE